MRPADIHQNLHTHVDKVYDDTRKRLLDKMEE